MNLLRRFRWPLYIVYIVILVALRYLLSTLLSYNQMWTVTAASILALLSGAYFLHVGIRGVTPDMVNPRFTRVVSLVMGSGLLLGGIAGVLWLRSDTFPTPERLAQERIAQMRRTADPALDLSDLKLTSLPPEVSQLPKLRYLNLSDNRLTKLPADIGTMRQLQSLRLSHNQLATLPPEIGALDRLTRLEVSDNALTQLPPEMGRLTRLEYLDLGNNKLTALPPEIGQLTRLETLILSGNPLETLPAELDLLVKGNELNLIYTQDKP